MTERTGSPDPGIAYRQCPQLWEAPQPPRTVGPGCWLNSVPEHPLHTQLSLPSRVTHRALHRSPPCEPGPQHLHLTLWGTLGAGQRWYCHRHSGLGEDTRAEEMSPASCRRQGVCTIRTRQDRPLCPLAPLSAKCQPGRMPGSCQAPLRLQCH